MRKRTRNHYTVGLGDSEPHRISRAQFWARLSVGAIYRPDPQRKPKHARISPGYRAWVADGQLYVRRYLPWWHWRAMCSAKIRTNAQVIEQLAILAIWTPWTNELERQREAALQYAD